MAENAARRLGIALTVGLEARGQDRAEIEEVMCMKNLFSLVLCAALVVMCMGCTAFAGADTVTITKSAQGFGGEVTVTLTFEGDDIVDAKIVGEQETP